MNGRKAKAQAVASDPRICHRTRLEYTRAVGKTTMPIQYMNIQLSMVKIEIHIRLFRILIYIYGIYAILTDTSYQINRKLDALIIAYLYIICVARFYSLNNIGLKRYRIRTPMNSNYICYYIVGTYKLAAPRKPFLCPSFVQYDTRLLRQKAVGACMYIVYTQDGHWLVASLEFQFGFIPPPKKLVFSRRSC